MIEPQSTPGRTRLPGRPERKDVRRAENAARTLVDAITEVGDRVAEIEEGVEAIEAVQDDGVAPAKIALATLTATTGIEVSPEGASTAWLNLTWVVPFESQGTNVPVEDGGAFAVRHGLSGQSGRTLVSRVWEGASGDTISLLLTNLPPGRQYAVSVEARDRWGNTLGPSDEKVWLTAADDIPPSMPGPFATAVANPLRVQVTHNLNRAGMAPFTLEPDLDHLEVWAATTEAGAGDAKIGEIAANAAMLTAQTPVVAQFDLPGAVARWLSVVAVDRSGNRSQRSSRVQVVAGLIGTAQLEDASITTAKIGNLAVTDAKIANLSLAKLTVGTLGTDGVTLDEDGRLVAGGMRFDASGLRFVNPQGETTIDFSSAAGSAEMQGSFTGGSISMRGDDFLEFFTDVGAWALGTTPPSGWTAWTEPSGTPLSVLSVAGTTGGRVLGRTTAACEGGAQWQGPGSLSMLNSESLLRFRVQGAWPTFVQPGHGLILRQGDGSWMFTSNATRGVSIAVRRDVLGVPQLVIQTPGLQTNQSVPLPAGIAVGDWMLLRVRLVGDSCRARLWKEGTAEPTVWLAEAAIPEVPQPGRFALFSGTTTATGAGVQFDTLDVKSIGGAFNVDSLGRLFMGGTSFEQAPFRVSAEGVLRANGPAETGPWNNLTLLNSWTALEAGVYGTPAWRFELGGVRLRGLVVRPSADANVTFANLPAQARPAFRSILGGYGAPAAAGAEGLIRVDVQAGGNLSITSAPSGVGTSYVSLAPLFFGLG